MIEILSTIQTPNTNPIKNLALEEYLLTHVKPNECILYLWQNKHTVVIGRNQNSWKECKVKELEESGGQLVRRLSGGGAVYHDMGNLNFTFLVHKDNYNVERQLGVIIKALEYLGIPAVKSGRNDITVFDKKVSGNAFFQSGDSCYHHGTLLIDVNLEHLSRYLNVSTAKMKSHGVDSVRSRVANLKEFNQEINVQKISEALIKAFGEVYEGTPIPLSMNTIDKSALCGLEEKFASWEWRFGRNIPFQIEFIKRFSWGEVQLLFDITLGVVTNTVVYTDAMDTDFVPQLTAVITGTIYDSAMLCEKIRSLQISKTFTRDMKDDICSLIMESIS